MGHGKVTLHAYLTLVLLLSPKSGRGTKKADSRLIPNTWCDLTEFSFTGEV
jgi:hypothetical protein